MIILRRTPTAFAKLGIEAYAFDTELQTIGAGSFEGHGFSVVEYLARAGDGLAFWGGAAFAAVGGVVGEVGDFFHF